jgi:DNA-binding PucR family transcriptional regulator
VVRELAAAGSSAAAAVNALRAAPAWPDAPRPVAADDLLPERVLSGDEVARRRLIDDVFHPLVAAGATLLETLSAYLEQTASLEATARLLFVHPNTVRYRLRRVGEVTGLTPLLARDAYTLRIALTVGRLDPSAPQ